MQTHVKTLGILYIVFGALGILAGLFVLLFFGGIVGVIGMTDHTQDAQIGMGVVGLIGTAICLIVVIVSLPSVIAGVGLLYYQNWARILTLVLSALNLLNVPIGTALGAYGFWVLLSAGTEPLFVRRTAYPAPL